MTDTTKAQILEVARKAIHTEMLSLKRMEDTLGDEFATAVEMILGSRGKCIVTGMGKSGLASGAATSIHKKALIFLNITPSLQCLYCDPLTIHQFL